MFTFRSGHELQHEKTQNCLLQLTEQFIVLYFHVKRLLKMFHLHGHTVGFPLKSSKT